MQNKLILAAFALCCSSIAFSQEADTVSVEAGGMTDESAFTFSEAQLGESDDMAANVTILNSNSNIYAPVRWAFCSRPCASDTEPSTRSSTRCLSTVPR